MKAAVYETLSPGGKAALAEEKRQLEVRVLALQVERDEKERSLAETTALIDICGSAIRTISSLLGMDAGIADSDDASPRITKPPEESRSTRDSIIEAITGVFSERNNAPLHYRELATLVSERGVALGGKDAAGTLLAILTNARYSQRFERCGRGIYKPVKNPPSDNTPAHSHAKLRKSRRRKRARRATH